MYMVAEPNVGHDPLRSLSPRHQRLKKGHHECRHRPKDARHGYPSYMTLGFEASIELAEVHHPQVCQRSRVVRLVVTSHVEVELPGALPVRAVARTHHEQLPADDDAPASDRGRGVRRLVLPGLVVVEHLPVV